MFIIKNELSSRQRVLSCLKSLFYERMLVVNYEGGKHGGLLEEFTNCVISYEKETYITSTLRGAHTICKRFKSDFSIREGVSLPVRVLWVLRLIATLACKHVINHDNEIYLLTWPVYIYVEIFVFCLSGDPPSLPKQLPITTTTSPNLIRLHH